jgi:hypothetical protein
MDSKWAFHRIYMESIWNEMDSKWNGMTKMAGITPKTYSIWNGWNPPGMIWNPHGFHVECGGRVKTSLIDTSDSLHDIFFVYS